MFYFKMYRKLCLHTCIIDIEYGFMIPVNYIHID